MGGGGGTGRPDGAATDRAGGCRRSVAGAEVGVGGAPAPRPRRPPVPTRGRAGGGKVVGGLCKGGPPAAAGGRGGCGGSGAGWAWRAAKTGTHAKKNRRCIIFMCGDEFRHGAEFRLGAAFFAVFWA